MPHFCRICRRLRANESFSGKGHSRHICKKCSRLPKSEIQLVDETNELYGFLEQRNISQKNIARLGVLSRSAEPATARLAKLISDIAKAKPHKRKRIKFLARNRRDIIDRMVEMGLLMPRAPEEYEPSEIYDDEIDHWPDGLSWIGDWIEPCKEYYFIGFDASDADERSSLYLEPEHLSEDEECLHGELQPSAPEAGESHFTYQFADPPENRQPEDQVIADVLDDNYYYSW